MKVVLLKDLKGKGKKGDIIEISEQAPLHLTGLCDYLGIPVEETYAIGDSINDLEMLQFVGHSIAMGNASQSAKDVAEYITTHIHEDGILNALRHYNLI